MPNVNEIKKRIESEAQAITPIQNSNLVCRDCFHRGGRVDMCGAFPNVKPGKVFNGGDCPEYKKEKTE